MLWALLGAVASAAACTIPNVPLSNNITEKFSIYVQATSTVGFAEVNNKIMNFRANGDDQHLVLRPAGVNTGDVLYLVNGILYYDGPLDTIHAVIDLEVRPYPPTAACMLWRTLTNDSLVRPQ